jgi:hypothetical protein
MKQNYLGQRFPEAGYDYSIVYLHGFSASEKEGDRFTGISQQNLVAIYIYHD